MRKDDILQALFVALDPYDFYPCYYKEATNYDTFYVYNCFEALQALVYQKLQFKCLGKESDRPEGVPIVIHLKMEVCEFTANHINYSNKIRYALCDLFNNSTCTLDLSEFRRNLEFRSIVVPMHSSKTLTDTIHSASKLFAQTVNLNMQNNLIKNCKGFCNLNSFMKLKSLDLRNNLISSIKDLQGLPTLELNELWIVRFKVIYKNFNLLCIKLSGPKSNMQ